MTNYEKKILNDLLDRFERSKSFIGSNKVNQRFSVKLAKLFPTYDDEAKYEPYIAIMDAMEKLESKQYVTVTLQKNGIPDSVALNTQMLQQIYAALGRIPKADVNETLRRILLQYRSQNEVLQTYCNEQLERLAHNKKVEFFDAEREMSEYENILKAVSQIFDVDEETYIRDFSVRVWLNPEFCVNAKQRINENKDCL